VSKLAPERGPLIYAAGVSLICADQRTEGRVNQRFIIPAAVCSLAL